MRMRLGLSAAAICFASMIAPTVARAGAVGACAAPFAFRNADVNVIVLPYFPAARGRPLGGLGNELALLVKLETLYRALSYNNWAVTLLTGPSGLCEPKRVTDYLFAKKMVRPGSRLIVVFGNLYQRDDDIYVQTFAQTYQVPSTNGREPAPDVSVQLGASRLVGSVRRDELAFPPELLSAAFIRRIADNYAKAMFIYSGKSLSASKRPLPLLDDITKCDDCHASLAFGVVSRSGDWVQIKMPDGSTGYLYARQENTTVGDRLPELSFIHGLLGFLRYNGVGQDATTSSGVRAAMQAFEQYAAREETFQEPETRAAAWQMAGILGFTFNKVDPSERMDAAYQLVPFSAEARNLAAMFRLARAYNADGKHVRPREVANDFLAAAALDPANRLVLANVQTVYELMRAPATTPKIDATSAIGQAEIGSQLAKVRAIRARPASP